MIDRYHNLFSLAFLTVVLAVLVIVANANPIICTLGRTRVDVPWAPSASVLPDSDRALEISVTKDRRILVGLHFVPAQTLRRELDTIATMSTDRQILISADPSVPFALVQDILAASRDAGFTNVALVTFRGTRLEAVRRGAHV